MKPAENDAPKAEKNPKENRNLKNYHFHFCEGEEEGEQKKLPQFRWWQWQGNKAKGWMK